MKITVQVKPNSTREKVEQQENGQYYLWVRAAAREGKANQAAIKLLSSHFGIAKSRIILFKGHTAKHKIFEIQE